MKGKDKHAQFLKGKVGGNPTDLLRKCLKLSTNKKFDALIFNNMAIAIKAIPTLYGEDAVRFREEIENVDKQYGLRPERDLTQDPRYAMMKKILSKAKLFK